MADIKWSSFSAGTTIAGTDTTVGLQGGANVKWTFSQLLTYITGALVSSGTGNFVKVTTPTLVTPVLGAATATSVTASSFLKTTAVIVSSLPAAATAGVGATAFVTDANATVILGLGLTVVGGGANKVPVYSDGTNWIVG